MGIFSKGTFNQGGLSKYGRRPELVNRRMPTTSVVNPSEPSYEGRDDENYLSQLRDIMFAEGPAVSEYRKHVRDIPEPEPVSGWRRVGAALLGAGVGGRHGGGEGFAAAQGILGRPYESQMEQWQQRGDALGTEAQIEDQNVQRRLAYLREMRAAGMDERKIDLEMRKIQADIDYRKAQDETNRYRADRGAEATLGAAGISADARMYGANAAAGASQYRTDVGANTSRYRTDVGAETSRYVADTGAKARTDAAGISANRLLGTNQNPILNAQRADQLAFDMVVRENPQFENLFIEGTDRIRPDADPMLHRSYIQAITRKKRILMGQDVDDVGNINLPGAGGPDFVVR